jgi:hypothetical protein
VVARREAARHDVICDTLEEVETLMAVEVQILMHPRYTHPPFQEG